ncbi:IclR family transcriptional regulator [Nocardia sp. NPDC127526]|uniref:IclR family transcriptional regulator n=1 Tax=Nocardia sp. NPDC127526 TaxID=3345393 RepID=UPI003640FCB1
MPGSIQSIERAAAMLQLLARGSGRLGVGEIAAALGLAKPTAHGILRTLQGVGFVEQDPVSGKYQLGSAIHELGGGYLDANELRSRAINRADALAARSGESVRIAAPVGNGVSVVHHVFRPDNTEQALEVGTTLPPHATALGKVLLAYDSQLSATVREGELPAFTHRTIVDRAVLGRALTEVRRTGWAGDIGEYRSAEASIAAPVRGRGGLVVGAIGISGPIDQLCDGQLRFRPGFVGQVRDAAQAVSRDLGGAQ